MNISLHHKIKKSVSFVLMAGLSGCTAFFHQPTGPQRARLGEETPVTNDLRSLPLPKEKIVAAVYKFRDQTGQYKQSEAGSTFSSAISQGTTNILLKALEESGWFITIERENIANLLNERKIVRSSVTQFKEGENLPPLLFAGVILEGGIVSYDANIITGGAGLRYFATGGSTQYRQDRVTVYLRAVSTRSGKILKTVYTSKTILSQSIDSGVFRYVTFKRLLEAETGFTTNEPAQMAVTEAIEKGVQSLVIEGIRDELWSVADKSLEQSKAVLAAYEKEKGDMSETDVYGMKRTDRQGSLLTILPYGAAWRYHGDLIGPLTKPGFGLITEVAVTPAVGIRMNVGSGSLASQSDMNTRYTSLDGGLVWRVLPFQKITPLVWAGAGLLARQPGNWPGLSEKRYFTVNGGVGLHYSPGRRIGLRAMASYYQPFSDEIDGRVTGSYNDYFLSTALGVTFQFGQLKSRKTRTSPAISSTSEK